MWTIPKRVRVYHRTIAVAISVSRGPKEKEQFQIESVHFNIIFTHPLSHYKFLHVIVVQ